MMEGVRMVEGSGERAMVRWVRDVLAGGEVAGEVGAIGGWRRGNEV